MTKKLICPKCEVERLVEPVGKTKVVTIKGEKFSVDVKLWKCLSCKEQVEDPSEPCDELDLAYREYRAKHKMLQPEQIREAREGLSLTQAELAKLLGWSPATLSRYEGGALQEKSHDNILQSLNEPIYVLGLLDRGKDLLSAGRFKKVKEIVRENLEHRQSDYLIRGLELRDPDVSTGNTRFNFEKYGATVRRMAARLGGVPKTKMNKLLYYTDSLSFKRNMRSVTGSRYVHLPFGPCPEDYQSLLGIMTDTGFIEIEEKTIGKGNTAEIIKAIERDDEDVLTSDEKVLIDEVCDRIGDFDSEKLSNMSHKEKGYKLTAIRDIISYEYAQYLSGVR